MRYKKFKKFNKNKIRNNLDKMLEKKHNKIIYNKIKKDKFKKNKMILI